MDKRAQGYGAEMLRLLGQVMTLPIAAFIYGVEILVLAIRDIQKSAADGAATMVTGVAPARQDAAPGPASNTAPAASVAAGAGDTVAVARPAGAAFMEDRPMADNSLNDDMLKLVRYKILFVKRDYEVAFPEVEELVPDNITGNAFTAWKVAEFIQKLDDTRVPQKWVDKNYPRDFPDKRGSYTIDSLAESDKKYLRVYYEVLDRYVREKFKHEEEQIDVLKQIRDRMPERSSSGTSTASGTAASGSGAGGSGAGGAGGTGRGSAAGGRSGGGPGI